MPNESPPDEPEDVRGFVWSEVYDLADFASAPAEEGIYFVGIFDSPVPRPAKMPPIDDRYLGVWPEGFSGRYVGRAYKTTLRIRLKDHFEKSSNRNIRDHLKEHGDHSLSFIFITADRLPGPFGVAAIEHFFLTAAKYDWNKRTHERAAWMKALKEWSDHTPGSDLAGWWDPQDG